MKHGFVILDNDTPLLIATSAAQAETACDDERRRIVNLVRRANPDESEEEVQRKLDQHHVHYVMIPFVLPNHKERS